MMRSTMNELVERRFAMEACADIDGILATCTDDIERSDVGVPGSLARGKAAAAAHYAALLRELQALDLTPLNRFYGENVLLDEALWEARAIGCPFGVEGRGRLLRMRMLHLFEFRDGLIAREQVWRDWVAFAAQLGALPARPLA